MQVSSQYPPGTIRYVDIRKDGIIVLKTYDGQRREYREVGATNLVNVSEEKEEYGNIREA